MKDWTIWLEFEAYDPSQKWDPATEFFNMSIRSPDGRVWALNVWAYGALNEIRREAKETGDQLQGKYLLPPDLLVERADRSLMEQVVEDLVRNEELKDEWLCEPGDYADIQFVDGDATSP